MYKGVIHMDVTIRRSEDGKWGFVESFSVYRYGGKGVINVLLAVTAEGRIAPSYVMRGGKFIPADAIDVEMGIDKYIKAKKPFYTLLSDGFIANVKAGFNTTSGEFLPEKTSFSIFKFNSNPDSVGISEGVLSLRKIHESSEQLETLMYKIARQVSLCKGDRRIYLLSRL